MIVKCFPAVQNLFNNQLRKQQFLVLNNQLWKQQFLAPLKMTLTFLQVQAISKTVKDVLVDQSA